MGILLNPNNAAFKEAVNSEIYVDKSELIKNTNKVLCTKDKYVCVSRPRRFGKSTAADMLVAYYSKGCDSKELFSSYKISNDDLFEKHLNKYNVIHINILDYFTEAGNITDMIKFIEEDLTDEFETKYSSIKMPRRKTIVNIFDAIYVQTSIPFVFIIDEWDCIFRKKNVTTEMQTQYLDFLRYVFKDKTYVALAYMTGILPIKKYGEHSALNMFVEISMTNAREYAEFTGFTEEEVQEICDKYDMPFDEVKRWYDGYNINGISIYNPRSVVMSATGHDIQNYWTATETYEALKVHILTNFDGLKEKIVAMIGGQRVPVDTVTFQNDMTSMSNADDVLTLLVHLGYLTYNSTGVGEGEVWIPNSEVRKEFISSIKDGGYEHLVKIINNSEKLLEATLNCDSDKVAELIEEAHIYVSSMMDYNSETALASSIYNAYITAVNKYVMHREYPTGKGFADLIFIPRRNVDSPAIVVELKYKKSAFSAIQQIKDKKYTDKVAEYTGDILLVGINYDDNKGHTCVIEKFVKE